MNSPSNFQKLPEIILRPIVEAALREDIRSGDITTNALIETSVGGHAQMNAREAGTVCGVELARLAFVLLDAQCRVQVLADDGAQVLAGASILEVQGSGAAVLSGERVALNWVQRLSGIATLTAQFVSAVAGTSAHIADTRKTTPGLRLLEKYAVRCGGGRNHRFALDDMILIKDNHIALCGGIEKAIQRARNYAGHSVKIEVECDTIEQVEIAANCHPDIILFDNMAPDILRPAVALTRQISPQTLCEASGGITLQTVRAKAECGVDIISVGALTHSARALDIGLDIELQR